MKKRISGLQLIVTILLGGTLLLFAAACGNDDEDPATDGDTDVVVDGDADEVDGDDTDVVETDGDVVDDTDPEDDVVETDGDTVEIDGDVEDETEVEVEEEVVEPIACETYGESMDLLPEDIPTQIQPDIAWDGYALWLVYTAKYSYGEGDEDNSLQVFAARLDCNGTFLTDPFRVSQQDTVGYLNPKVAISGGNIMVAYASDNSELAPRNLNIFTRRYTVEGEAVDENEVIYQGTRKGAVNDGNAWMPDVAALPDGEFILVGAWGHDDASGFQAFAQRFNADGSHNGEAIDMLVGDDQMYPRVDTLADGTAYIVFQSFNYTGPSFNAKLAYDATEVAAEDVGHIITDNKGDTPSVCVTPEGDKAFAVWSQLVSNRLKPTVKDITSMDADGASQNFGTANPYSLAPALSLNSASEGIVAYITTRRPPFGNVTYNRFEIAEDGTYTILGGSPLINTEKAVSIYGVNIARIAADEFMVVWSEGSNPDFKVRGHLVKLEEIGDLCDPNPCAEANQGVCELDYTTETGYACGCDEGYMFNDEGVCVVDHCFGDPCAELADTHRNVCVRDSAVEDGYICECESGWRLDGDTDLCVDDLCDPNPCTEANESICTEDASAFDGYTCQCDPGYINDEAGNCVLPCDTDPCFEENRTVCVNDETAPDLYVCHCDDGFVLNEAADKCEYDPCEPNPCTYENESLCIIDFSQPDNYICQCDPGYINDEAGNCVLPCDTDPCYEANRSECVNDATAPDLYVCNCDNGYELDEQENCVPVQE